MSRPQDAYRKWMKRDSFLPLFFQPWWLDIVCNGADQWGVVLHKNKEEEIDGVLVYYQKRRLGLSGIDMPMLTPIMGPWIIYPTNEMKRHSRYSFEAKILEALLTGLPKTTFFKQKWPWQMQNYLPFYWEGYRSSTNYTYLITDLADLDRVWGDFSNNVRSRITNKANNYQIRSTDSIERLYELQVNRLKRNQVKIPFSAVEFSALWEAIQSHEAGKIYEAVDPITQEVVAAILIVFDQQEAYLLMTGFRGTGKSAAIPLLIWQAIQDCAQNLSVFNFEGSMIPGIEQFFRAFGGKMQAYHRITKINLPIIGTYLAKL